MALSLAPTGSIAEQGPTDNPSTFPNSSWANPTQPSTLEDLAAVGTIGALLSAMGLVGVAGNTYTLVVTCRCPSAAASLRVYVISLALADLLYLLGIPFIVATYVTRQWHFGTAGCRVLFSLDFLTMHASIFTLVVMSRERCNAVLRPLDTLRRSRGLQKRLALGSWLLALLLALPMMLAIRLVHLGPKCLCLPAWGPHVHRAYLTLLFCTSIVGPGLVIALLYGRLAWAYWRSQRACLARPRRLPNPRVLRLLLGIVLLFWTCFLPFWLWQLLAQYGGDLPLSPSSVRIVNYLTTCLTYANSCMNPFLYTLLTQNFRQRHQLVPMVRGPHPSPPSPSRLPCGSSHSLSSSSPQATETIALSQAAPAGGWA